METDSSNAIQAINSLDDLSYQGLIASDISKFLQYGGGSSCHFISCEVNNVAHALAKSNISFAYAMYWIEELPDCVAHIVVVDISE